MANRFHVNPKTGNPGPCSAEINCPFGDMTNDHYNSPEEARAAYEANQETFSTVIRKDAKTTTSRAAVISDVSLSATVEVAQARWNEATEKEKVTIMEETVSKVEVPKESLYNSLPGSPEREALRAHRNEARETLLAYDIVAWRDSEFYNSGVEERMKERVSAVIDADSSLESALADRGGISATAKQFGVSDRDVENVLETVHSDYLRPRNSVAKSIGDLSQDGEYASTTAYLFRMKPTAVQGILAYASNYSAAPTSTTKSQTLADILAD